MKKIFVLALLSASLAANAQFTAPDIFRNTPVFFYGVDFTKAKIEHPYYNQEELQTHYFPEWNYLFLQDVNKKALRECFDKSDVKVNIDPLLQVNALGKFNFLSGASLEREAIKEAIGRLSLPDAKGIGVVLFAGELKGKGERFYGKLAFFDIQTKELLMLKKVYGEGESFGFRNTVAKAIRHSLLYTRKKWGGWKERVS